MVVVVVIFMGFYCLRKKNDKLLIDKIIVDSVKIECNVLERVCSLFRYVI